MPYPNNSPYNIVIAQTSGSAVDGQYPFTERIISGSNLFIVTDANGFLTASAVTATSSVAISASYALTSSFSQFSQTASYLTPTNNYTVNQLTGSDVRVNNLTVTGNIVGSIQTSSLSLSSRPRNFIRASQPYVLMNSLSATLRIFFASNVRSDSSKYWHMSSLASFLP
jgi:hypothetical protein